MQAKKVDKYIIETVIQRTADEKGCFSTSSIRDWMKTNGHSYGSDNELIEFAETQKTRYFIGRLFNNGKRKCIALFGQTSLFGESESVYCLADRLVGNQEGKGSNRKRMRKMMVSLVSHSPILPEWAIEELVSTINQIFEKIEQSA